MNTKWTIGMLLALLVGITIFAIFKSKEAERNQINMLEEQRKAEECREEAEKLQQEAELLMSRAAEQAKLAKMALEDCASRQVID